MITQNSKAIKKKTNTLKFIALFLDVFSKRQFQTLFSSFPIAWYGSGADLNPFSRHPPVRSTDAHFRFIKLDL